VPCPAFATPACRAASARPAHPRLVAQFHRPAHRPESAQGDLDEAWEIAAAGPMPLFLRHPSLSRAALLSRESLPVESPQLDLAELVA